MQTTVTLSEEEMHEAFRLYLAGKGWRVTGKPTIRVEDGDRPGDLATIATTIPAVYEPRVPATDTEEPAR